VATVLQIARTIAVAPEPLGPFLAYAIVRQSDGRAIGDVGFHGSPELLVSFTPRERATRR
jgi:hypothetical protein